jgi:hypothetical protein
MGGGGTVGSGRREFDGGGYLVGLGLDLLAI